MGPIVVVLLLALVLAAVVMVYAAYPYRGEETPSHPVSARRCTVACIAADAGPRRAGRLGRPTGLPGRPSGHERRPAPLTCRTGGLIGSLHEQRPDLHHPRRRDPRDRRGVGLVAFVNGRKQPPRRDLPPPRPRARSPRSAPRGPGADAGHHPRAPRGYGGPAGPPAAAALPVPGRAGTGLLMLLSRDRLDEDTWEEIEDTLITADVGVAPTQELVERLRTRMRVEGMDATTAPTVLREELIALVDPSMDRRLGTDPSTASRGGAGRGGQRRPARPPLSARSRGCWWPRTSRWCSVPPTRSARPPPSSSSTWGERVGVDVVTGPEGSDPASVAFESVRAGSSAGSTWW